jgi:hypothetical protein
MFLSHKTVVGFEFFKACAINIGDLSNDSMALLNL